MTVPAAQSGAPPPGSALPARGRSVANMVQVSRVQPSGRLNLSATARAASADRTISDVPMDMSIPSTTMRNCGSRTGARAVLPLADAGVIERDVLEWWKHQPFDLGIPSYAGNCVLCFLKGRAKLLRLIREDPSRADWWIEQERRVSNRTNAQGRACESMKRFRLGETYEELRAAAFNQADLFDDAVADAETFDCHCTD